MDWGQLPKFYGPNWRNDEKNIERDVALLFNEYCQQEKMFAIELHHSQNSSYIVCLKLDKQYIEIFVKIFGKMIKNKKNREYWMKFRLNVSDSDEPLVVHLNRQSIENNIKIAQEYISFDQSLQNIQDDDSFELQDCKRMLFDSRCVLYMFVLFCLYILFYFCFCFVSVLFCFVLEKIIKQILMIIKVLFLVEVVNHG